MIATRWTVPPVAYGTTAGGTEPSAEFGYDAFDRGPDRHRHHRWHRHDGLRRPRPAQFVTQARGTVTYDYDTLGRQHSTTITGQPATTYGYDTSGLLTSVTQGSTGVGIAHTPTGQQAKTTLPGGWSQTPDYDDAGRLKSITYANGTTAKGSLTYTYDKAGRVRKVAGTMANLQLPTARAGMVYNDANRLTSVAGTALSYDDDGNLTNDGAAAYTWNARGDLTGLSKTGTTATFAYDGLGLRSARTVNGTKTGFLNDGANTAAELDASNTVTSSLLSGGVDQWFARTKAGTTDAVLTDAQGSPVALGAADGTMGARYGYDPYGLPTSTGDGRGSDLSYTGRQDDGTGLMYGKVGYYSPGLQRFISEDPAGVAGGTNLYEYAGGSPTNATDPSSNIPRVALGSGAPVQVRSNQPVQTLSGRKAQWADAGDLLGGVASLVGICFLPQCQALSLALGFASAGAYYLSGDGDRAAAQAIATAGSGVLFGRGQAVRQTSKLRSIFNGKGGIVGRSAKIRVEHFGWSRRQEVWIPYALQTSLNSLMLGL